ncbi:hypothetical protein Aca07nite_53730 [Actinoplanes capillaceus]|uniref:Uncharacterized protein n=1 Tax=Actinoplanes campanulatus TaxID=113559 RepID=A0ABQ3WPF1_9ACTN|nr:hypothetical protein [Actinoplanes capillaceus]GID48098.1 hypothetical protein Aca07nite_53730 [Actinoplanes capillaceus]
MRYRYLGMLCAAAIVQVVVHQHFGWPWLSAVLPAMGVLFAAAGSLTTASLRKRAAKPAAGRPAPDGPIPAGWPEVARDQPAPAPDPLADAVTRRITAAQRADLPVAGRPVPGYGPAHDAGYDGAPRSGYSAPRHTAGSRPLSLRFRGPDGRT